MIIDNVQQLQKILGLSAQTLCRFLSAQLPLIGGENWWETHVHRQLSYSQQAHIRTKGIQDLSKLDLAALLRVFDRNWGELSFAAKLSSEVRTHFKEIGDIRNQMAHLAAEGEQLADADAYRSYDTLRRAMTAIQADANVLERIQHEAQACLARMSSVTTKPEIITVEREVVREVPVEVIKEVIREVPVEVIREISSPILFSHAQEPAGGIRIGSLRLHGPSEPVDGTLPGFDGKDVEATLIPWSLYGDGGLHFSIQIAMIDEGTAKDVGQVVCTSRNHSPQLWDDVVQRLRIGIRDAGKGQWIMDLRSIERPNGARAGRKVWTLPEYQSRTGINLQQTLTSLGAIAVDTRAALMDDRGKNRNIPAMLFEPGDSRLPAVAWALTTLVPLL